MDRFHEPDLAGPAFKAGPYAYWTALRDHAPVHAVRLRNGALAWLVTRYDDAVAVLGNPQFVKDPLKAKGDGASGGPWLPGPLRALSRTQSRSITVAIE